MDILYSIKHLHQYYTDKNGDQKTILKIENLHILKNKFTVILGNSGSGKTTLLEILGVINEINEGDVVYLPNSENISFKELWCDKEAHSLFLRKKLAFTFQDANLLSYFNVSENIAIPTVIEKDIALQEAVKEVEKKNILKNFGIEKIKNKKIEVISGGEQQRVALARSSNSFFDVFLTDEPTGNVGVKHEEVIFKYLRNLVNKEGKSVIVVTHNIQKALEFADQLIIITQKGNMGLITSENVLNLDNRMNSCLLTLNGQLLNIPIFSPLQNAMTIYNPALLNIIKNRMGALEETEEIETEINKIDKDFKLTRGNYRKSSCKFCKIINSVFGTIGKFVEKQINFLSFLFIIPFLKNFFKTKHENFVFSYIDKDIKRFFKGKVFSFLIIFILSLFAISSYTAWDKILKKKLNNPFVNVLLVKNNSSKSLDEIKEILLNDKFKKRFYTSMITPTQSVSIKFINKQNENDYAYLNGRTINKDDPLLFKLYEYSEDTCFKNEKELGFFVTKSFLYKLGYNENDKFLRVVIANKNLYLPVIGVFKFLPGDTFLITNTYYKMINSGAFFYDNADFFALVDLPENNNFSEEFSDFLENNNVRISSILRIPYGLKFKFYNSYRMSFLDSLWENFKNKKNFGKIKPYIPPNEDFIPRKTKTIHYDWFFLHRTKISHSEELKEQLSKLNLQIDIEKISTQKDFKTISSLLKIAILFMEIITLISTLIFIKYSFYIHIFQLIKELGIIKSLGINEITLNRLFRFENTIFYFSIMSLGFGYLLLVQLLNFALIKFGVLKHFILSIISYNTLFHIAFIYFISVLALEYTLDKIVNLTAGNLIYDRLEK